MVFPLLSSSKNSFIIVTPKVPRVQETFTVCSLNTNTSSNSIINRPLKAIHGTQHILKPRKETTGSIDSVHVSVIKNKEKDGEKRCVFSQVGVKEMLVLCGLGYWVQGFRCFPWLALNFHMAHNLSLYPSTLQLVQNSANLPMVAKPLYGILSDVLYIGGAHRIPYICIGG